jgi:2-polyprenyl-3-methyl-5-hydroxy-6-metoxy-1,4-benzoquinol methylase
MQRSDSLIERMNPAIIDESDPEMVELAEIGKDRYRFASMFAEGKRVLCLACGVGYGCPILKSQGKASHVVGFDFDRRWVESARKHYPMEGISYDHIEQRDVNFEREFDLVVSHETFKYQTDPMDLLKRIERALKPGGQFIASVYTVPTSDFNPYHIRDYTYREFRRMLKKAGFTIVDELWQFKHYRRKDAINRARTKKPEETGDTSPRSLVLHYLFHPLQAVRRLYALIRHGFTTKIVTIRAVRTVDYMAGPLSR